MLKNKLQGVEDSLPTVASACAACLTADSPSHDINAVNAAYFRATNEQLCRNGIDLLNMAGISVSIPALYQVVISAPTSVEESQSEAWKKWSFFYQCLVEAKQRPKIGTQDTDLRLVEDYFRYEWPKLAEKTRSIICSTFTSACDVLNRGILRKLFCGETNVSPRIMGDGKIVFVDLPVLDFGSVGQFAQILWKYPFQRDFGRRDVKSSPRPVFLWQDEAQLFLIENDYAFQSTCRSARVATVMLSQNISNFYAVLGGEQAGKAKADSLFGNLNLKIFHMNGDSVTNTWAAELIGRSRQLLANSNSTNDPTDPFSGALGIGTSHNSAGVSEVFEFEVQPSVFTTFRTGGRENRWLVDALIFAAGSRFKASGRPYFFCSFSQV